MCVPIRVFLPLESRTRTLSAQRNGLHNLATSSEHSCSLAPELSEVLRRRVALAPVAELLVVLAVRLVDDHEVGDVLLAGRLHKLFHQGVRSHLQASRVASGWILRVAFVFTSCMSWAAKGLSALVRLWRARTAPKWGSMCNHKN